MSPSRSDVAALQILASIVESSDDAIIGRDLSGNVSAWNPGAERMFGYTASEMVGRPIRTIVPDDRSTELDMISQRLERGERIEPYESVRVTKSGRLIEVMISASPIRNASGRFIGASAILRDLSAKRLADSALRASEAKWRAMVDSAVDAVIVIDTRGHIEEFNEGAQRLFGYSPAEVIGHNVSMLMPPPHNVNHDDHIRRYLDTGQRHIIGIGREITARRRDGGSFPAHLSVGETRTGGERRFVGILHDLTARVQAEERLREQNALAKLGEMAAVLAHEVKNPLAAVSGAIQVIGDTLAPESSEAGIIKEILDRLGALNNLTDDLLRFARPPQPVLGPVDAASVIHGTSELLAADGAMREIRLELTGEADPVNADADLLRIILQNLIINAAQAMRGRGVIAVTLLARDGMVEIQVADSGPGVPVDQRAKLFQPFFTTKSRGTGLGLATSRRLIEAQGGSIQLTWPSQGGTTAILKLAVWQET